MPKVRIEFVLPEEQEEYKIHNNAAAYYSALWDFSQWMRSTLKHSESRPDLEQVQEEFYKILDNENIEL